MLSRKKQFFGKSRDVGEKEIIPPSDGEEGKTPGKGWESSSLLERGGEKGRKLADRGVEVLQKGGQLGRRSGCRRKLRTYEILDGKGSLATKKGIVIAITGSKIPRR